MIQNKTVQHFNYSAVEEIDPAKLPFDLKTPPKEVVRDILFATNLYAYKFNNCIHCVKKEEKSECCGGKKITARCEKLDITDLVAASCLFCQEFDHSLTVKAPNCEFGDTGSILVDQPISNENC